MRKFISKLFFLAGICASAFGLINPASATTNPISANTMPTLKATDSSEKLYFTDAIRGSDDLQLYAAHYSHRSHGSHGSHESHYSHRSSRY